MLKVLLVALIVTGTGLCVIGCDTRSGVQPYVEDTTSDYAPSPVLIGGALYII